MFSDYSWNPAVVIDIIAKYSLYYSVFTVKCPEILKSINQYMIKNINIILNCKKSNVYLRSGKLVSYKLFVQIS